MKISKIEVIHELVSLTNQNSNAKQINAAGAKPGKTGVRRVVIGCTWLVEKFARVVWTSSITKTNGDRVITFDTQVKTALSFWKPWPSLWERPFLQSRALWPGIWKVERVDLNLLWYKRYCLFCYGINCGDALHKRFETRTISSSCLVRSMVTSLPKGTVVK